MGKNKNPSYLALYNNGRLQTNAHQAHELLNKCSVCPHGCGVNRLEGELGICRIGAKARIASYGPHFGEESPLVGSNGSGTIFFEGCNLLCIFCQNCDISHIDTRGDLSPNAVDDQQFAEIMISLQEQGCHNINLVTPSHVLPQFLSALCVAVEKGLTIPIVYNTGGYDSKDTLEMLDGVIDIYMPDCKFNSHETAKRYTKATDYPVIMKKAVLEMHRQVGDLQINDSGLATHGLLVRHLLMPGHLDETEGILEFLATEISLETYINIMDQYRPCHKASKFKPINRSLTNKEYKHALKIAAEKNLNRLDQRDWGDIFRRLGL